MVRQTGSLGAFVTRLILISEDRHPRPSEQFLLAIVIILLAFGSATFFDPRPAPVSQFVLDYRSSAGGIVQVFYDLGHGIAEKDSSRITIDAKREYRTLRFPLGVGALSG